ncbi:MAG TPA: hypothetical protein VN781_00695 [Acidimicrobiales bacterium]|nr:hypothetical protein [Acidimicrobiales bacterium]
MASDYPYCWAWCCLKNDFEMLDRAQGGDGPPPEACYFDGVMGRWVLFHELPAEERARMLDPTLWDEIEAHRWADAPTRVDVGLGPRSLNPAVLDALRHREFSGGHPRGWSRRTEPKGATAS